MRESNEHAVDVLNGLIKTTLDSVGGYRDAAENADRSQYKAMFADRAAKREQLARELQQQVRTLGGEPKTEQGMLGKMHNEFVDLKNGRVLASDWAEKMIMICGVAGEPPPPFEWLPGKRAVAVRDWGIENEDHWKIWALPARPSVRLFAGGAAILALPIALIARRRTCKLRAA